MTIESAIELLQMMIWTSFVLISPILVTAITVGLAVSLLQTVTSIQEQTLVFVPKLLAVGAVLVVSAQWLLRGMVEFATLMIQKLPEMTA